MNIDNEIFFLHKEKYKVYSSGKICNLKDKPLAHGLDGRGYHFVFIYADGIKKQEKVHRLVATYFIPNIERKPQVNHIDGDKNNNCVYNLEWVTQSENMKHAFKIGLCKNTRNKAKEIGKLFGKTTVYKAIESTKKKVINTETLIVYESIREASEAIDIKYDTLRSQLNGINKNKTNLKYLTEYLN